MKGGREIKSHEMINHEFRCTQEMNHHEVLCHLREDMRDRSQDTTRISRRRISHVHQIIHVHKMMTIIAEADEHKWI